MIMYIENNRRKLETEIDEFVKAGGKVLRTRIEDWQQQGEEFVKYVTAKLSMPGPQVEVPDESRSTLSVDVEFYMDLKKELHGAFFVHVCKVTKPTDAAC